MRNVIRQSDPFLCRQQGTDRTSWGKTNAGANALCPEMKHLGAEPDLILSRSESVRQDLISIRAFVIKAEELPALNRLPTDFPRPAALEWIDRGRDAKLRTTTVEMLVRTLFRRSISPSVRRLHHSAGLRVIFRDTKDRHRFAIMFRDALNDIHAAASQSETDFGSAI